MKLSGDYTIGFGTDDKNPDVRYTVAEDAKIFYVDDDGEISEATLNSIKTDSDDTAMSWRTARSPTCSSRRSPRASMTLPWTTRRAM